MTPGLGAKVEAVKRYQQRRFAHTYADLLSNERYGKAASFFLNELYGPQDFTRRDAQFLRVVPALVRLFPADVVGAVCDLAELHELSESLDTQMGLKLTQADEEVGAQQYVFAWQACGHAAERERQISLTIQLGNSLDQLTRKPVLRHSLRMMRGPARAAGLAELQHLLETGFDAFKKMRGAYEFLQLIETRERNLAAAIFAAHIASSDASAAEAQFSVAGLP